MSICAFVDPFFRLILRSQNTRLNRAIAIQKEYRATSPKDLASSNARAMAFFSGRIFRFGR
jgi:hypothetical protein